MFARFWKEPSRSQRAAGLLAVSETSVPAGDSPEKSALSGADQTCPPILCHQASEAGDAALAAVIDNRPPASCDDSDLDGVVGGYPRADSHVPSVSRGDNERDGNPDDDGQFDGDHDCRGEFDGYRDDRRGLDDNRDRDDSHDEDDNLDDDSELDADVDDDREPLWVDQRSVDELPVGKIWPEAEPGTGTPGGPRKRRRSKSRLLVSPEEVARPSFTAPQRLLLLDTWQRSGLPAKDFADLVGLSKHTLYKWKQLFEQRGPEGLMDQPRGARTGSRLSEVTRRTILMLKQAHPEWGCQRISDALARGPALAARAAAIARVLREEGGYQVAAGPTRPHPTKERRFERARSNQLWQ